VATAAHHRPARVYWRFLQIDLRRDRTACAAGQWPAVAVSDGTKWSSVCSHSGRLAGIVIRFIWCSRPL